MMASRGVEVRLTDFPVMQYAIMGSGVGDSVDYFKLLLIARVANTTLFLCLW